MCFQKEIVKTILWSCILTFTVDACFIDLCTMLPEDFCEGRQCRMKSDCSTYECYCDENSTDPTCLNGSGDCLCVHGYCKTTDTNTTECVCLSGYRGQNCSEIQCPFDPCEYVCPGQDCRTLPDCTHECNCDENSTKCNPDANSSALFEHNPCFDNFTLRSLTERTCDSELTCLYGRCVNDNGTFVCKCDGEATGLQCQYTCCLDCGQHGECSYTELHQEYCNCSHNYTGDNCDTQTQQYNPCYDNFTMRTFLERSCDGGLLCIYGKCISEGKISTCVCDPGSDGIICQNQCCRECGKGQCRYNDTLESEYCDCPFNLTDGCYCDDNSTDPTCLNGSVDCPCVHGYCKTTDTNTTECVCLSGYRGQNCSEIQCPFDPCEYVCPGQDCRTLPDCTHECYCDENSTKCNPDANSSALFEYNPCFDNFTLRSLTERTCDSELTCLYGRCFNDNGSFVCKCDGESTGLQCQYTCCLDCGQHGECSYTDMHQEYCNCSHNYTGDNCETQTPQYNPCYDNFTMRTFLERSCDGGLLCIYGKCVSEGKNSTCVCDPGGDGIICQNQCCRKCGKGQCRYSDTLENEYCNCPFNLTGPYCNETRPGYGPESEDGPEEVITWHLWVVGVCAVVLIVLVVLMVVIPYLMWKHRNILLMKLVYYFQKYEDDDEREWDAFVSYRSLPRDESFVVHQLYPKLETELGFKLNLHFRDFIPGDTIANNIIRAVKGSRRTILIITPGYLQSEHTMFEFYVAQQAMLDRKHRIIPVLLEDVSDFKVIMDENLKTVLSSITYLEWPTEISDTKKVEKFWRRLQLSLPKKRPSSDTNKCSPSEFIAADDLKISVEPMKSKLINGSVYSNKGFQQDPETEYATINEFDIDQNRNAEEKYVTIEDFETNVEGYMKMLDPVSTC